MLKDVTYFKEIYIACGFTDLRKGIDGLATLVKEQFNLDPFQKDILFLFCGRRQDRFKGLVWEGDGFLLLYKRIEAGRVQWPRTSAEMERIDISEFRDLLEGFVILQKSTIKEVNCKKIA